MEKVQVEICNNFCPQAFFIYGTYKEDGTANFALFNWFSYCQDGDLHVMASIGGEKLTKDRIHEGKVFSANLVSEQMLPMADYFGNCSGYDTDKRNIDVKIGKGEVLPVPILLDSHWIYELEVEKTIVLDGSEVYICKIHNVLADKELLDESKSIEERMQFSAPVLSIGSQARKYLSVNSKVLGTWGDWKDLQ